MFVSLKSISVVETSRRMVSLLWQDATCYRLIDCTRSVSEGNLTANARATSCGAHRRKINETKKNKYLIFAAILKLKRNNDTATTAETTAAQTTTTATTTTRMQAASPATQAQAQ